MSNTVRSSRISSVALDDQDKELCGCSLSKSFSRVKRAQNIRHNREITKDLDEDLPKDEDDLSGCLVSGYVHRKNPNQRDSYMPMSRDDISGEIKRDDETSGFLSSGLLNSELRRSKKSPYPLPLSDEDIESGGLGSDWLYLN